MKVLLFFIASTPLIYMLKTCKGSNRFIKLQEKINHLMYTDDIKIFAKNEELETLIQTMGHLLLSLFHSLRVFHF